MNDVYSEKQKLKKLKSLDCAPDKGYTALRHECLLIKTEAPTRQPNTEELSCPICDLLALHKVQYGGHWK